MAGFDLDPSQDQRFAGRDVMRMMHRTASAKKEEKTRSSASSLPPSPSLLLLTTLPVRPDGGARTREGENNGAIIHSLDSFIAMPSMAATTMTTKHVRIAEAD